MAMTRRLLPLIYLFLGLGSQPGTAQGPFGQNPGGDPVAFSLVADTTHVVPGKTFLLAVKVEVRPNWHSYWINPGGSGLPTEVKWVLPDGFKSGETLYPVPHVIVDKVGDEKILSHTFEGTTYHLAEITVPDGLDTGTQVSFSVDVDWQACENGGVCTPPSQAHAKLDLPVGGSAQPSRDAPAIEKILALTSAKLPKATVTLSMADDETIAVEGTVPEGTKAEKPRILLSDRTILDPNADQKLDWSENTFTAKIKTHPWEFESLPSSTSGFLLLDSAGHNALAIEATSEGGSGTEAAAPRASAARDLLPDKESPEGEIELAAIEEMRSWGVRGVDGVVEKEGSRGLLLITLFAFLGGMILNLMPCVFPVLGIKIMGFVQQAGEDKSKIRKHGLVFGLGVLVSFWILVSVLLAIRALSTDGNESWGFQLQNTYFIAVLVAIMVVFGLNLLGWFEFGTSLMGAGSSLTRHQGYLGSFFSGVLAVVIATPCTGPFMGTAIGFALNAPTISAYFVFTALALGLAFPYVLLSFAPKLIQKLPKPGNWMITFKQFMAFPLFATAIWLASVFGSITGIGGMTRLLFSMVFLALGVWWLGRFGTPSAKPTTRWIARTACVMLALCGSWFVWNGARMKNPAPPDFAKLKKQMGIEPEHFSPSGLVASRKKGRTVFVDFTADW